MSSVSTQPENPSNASGPVHEAGPDRESDSDRANRPPAEFDTGLPSPYQFPERELIIFDGDCRFCLKQVRSVHRWDSRHRLAFVSLHDPYVAEHFPDLTKPMMMEQMYVITNKGRKLGGAAAARYLTRRIPRLWVLAPFLHTPLTLPIWQWGYRQIAKRRYKISAKMGQGCDDGACDIHFK